MNQITSNFVNLTIIMFQVNPEIFIEPGRVGIMKEHVKRKLVDEVNHNGESYREVAARYSVGYESLRKYAKCIRKGITLHEGDGRPPKLDQKSVATILSYIRESGNNDKYAIRDLIRDENQKTFSRRYPNPPADKSKSKVSRRTIQRWADKILTLV